MEIKRMTILFTSIFAYEINFRSIQGSSRLSINRLFNDKDLFFLMSRIGSSYLNTFENKHF